MPKPTRGIVVPSFKLAVRLEMNPWSARFLDKHWGFGEMTIQCECHPVFVTSFRAYFVLCGRVASSRSDLVVILLPNSDVVNVGISIRSVSQSCGYDAVFMLAASSG